jgi:phosphoribosylaminoimidazole-succinocarboxamide synthase
MSTLETDLVQKETAVENDQNVSVKSYIEVLAQEKSEALAKLTLSRARNQELFKEVVRLTEKLKEVGIESDDNIVLLDEASG